MTPSLGADTIALQARRRKGMHRIERMDGTFLGDLYSRYYPRASFSVSDYRPSPAVGAFRSWLRGDRSHAYAWVPERVRVLDVGCGLCETLGYHAGRGCEVHGVEADESARRIAAAFGFDVRVGLFDPSAYPPSSFDYVTLDQVLEHMTDPVSALRGVAQVLRPGGTAVVSIPNGDGWGSRLFGRRWINWHPPYHSQVFSRRSATLAAERAGLEVAGSAAITHSDWLLYQWLHLATYPAAGVPSAFWTGGRPQTFRARTLQRLAILVHWSGVDHLATRLLDAASVGDNLVILLRKNVAGAGANA